MNPLIEAYAPMVLEISEEIQNKAFDFAYVLPEIESIQFYLMEHPDDSLSEFNRAYSIVQAYQSRITTIIIEIRKEKQIWLIYKSRVDKLFKRLRSILMSGRDDIKSLKNQDLREAAIANELSDVVRLTDVVNDTIDDLDYLIDICELKRDDLERANTNMSRQQKVVESLIGLGYGAQK